MVNGFTFVDVSEALNCSIFGKLHVPLLSHLAPLYPDLPKHSFSKSPEGSHVWVDDRQSLSGPIPISPKIPRHPPPLTFLSGGLTYAAAILPSLPCRILRILSSPGNFGFVYNARLLPSLRATWRPVDFHAAADVAFAVRLAPPPPFTLCRGCCCMSDMMCRNRPHKKRCPAGRGLPTSQGCLLDHH